MDTTPDHQLVERLLAMTFAARLIAARKRQNLTQQQLADRVGEQADLDQLTDERTTTDVIDAAAAGGGHSVTDDAARSWDLA